MQKAAPHNIAQQDVTAQTFQSAYSTAASVLPPEQQAEPKPGTVTRHSPAAEKIRLFRALFSGRSDVFALRWENSSGRSGYSPVCKNKWAADMGKKPLH